MEAIRKAVDTLGGQPALAKALGVTPGAVGHWCVGYRPVPPKRCIPIEKATEGAVTRYDLRPDVFGKGPDDA